MAEEQDKPATARGEANRNPERQGPPRKEPPPREEGDPSEVESDEPPPESRTGDSGEATPRMPGR